MTPGALRRLRAVAGLTLAAAGACGPAPDGAPREEGGPEAAPGEGGAVGDGARLFVWTTDSDSVDLNFLTVLDAQRGSPTYGEILATLPVPTEGPIRGHHTEHRMPSGGVLFANDFRTGRTYLLDLSDPLAPALADSFTAAGPLTYPHSFERLADGSVIATFQTQGEGNRAPGGIAVLEPDGAARAWASAAAGGEEVRPYSLAPVPALDRVVTGSADMRGAVDSRVVQVWRLGEPTLLHTLDFPAEWGAAAEPRVLADGRTVLVATFGCALLRVRDLDSDTPSLEKVFDFGGEGCALPVVAGNLWIQAVPSIHGLVALDTRDPARPVEVARVVLGEDDWPHWISLSPDGRRIVVTGYRGTRFRVLLVDLDPATGSMSVDGAFTSPGAEQPGVRFDRASWPHGATGPGDPHGAVFSLPPG